MGRNVGRARQYDARGNVTTTVDSATIATAPLRYATTQYQWDAKWDFPTRVTNPEGDFDESAYSATNGNLLWRQDGRGVATRTNFTYVTTGAAAGMLQQITNATAGVVTRTYDARA